MVQEVLDPKKIETSQPETSQETAVSAPLGGQTKPLVPEGEAMEASVSETEKKVGVVAHHEAQAVTEMEKAVAGTETVVHPAEHTSPAKIIASDNVIQFSAYQQAEHEVNPPLVFGTQDAAAVRRNPTSGAAAHGLVEERKGLFSQIKQKLFGGQKAA